MRKMQYDTDPVIEKMVYDKYPVTRKEKKCAIEKSKVEYLRSELRKRLYKENGEPIVVPDGEIRMDAETYNKVYFK